MRIEEHGLHVWMGFYHHAFGMMKEALDALVAPPSSPLNTIDDAFEPAFRVSFSDADHRTPWTLSLPPRPGVPWEEPPSLWDDLRAGSLARFTRAGVWRQVLGDASREPQAMGRRAQVMARLMTVITRGLIRDALPKRNLDLLDDFDLRAWLRRHGGDDALTQSPPVNALYDLAFAFPDGMSASGRGDVAAGAALRAMWRIAFGYRGAPLWRMRFGMGDTVFAPLYAVLRQRGVRFRFFHRVEDLHVDGRGRAIDAITVVEQAQLVGDDYAPLVTVKGLPCWPKTPRREQLAGVGATGDFEDPGCRAGVLRRLRRGREFDAVVLAIPVGALAPLTRELSEVNPRFRTMLSEARTVATCALQLWLRPDLRALGWCHGPTVLTSHGELFRNWGDMTGMLAAEDWSGPHSPRTLAHFCDVCPDHVDMETLHQRTERWLDDDLVRLWPGARNDAGRFDRRLLAVADGREGRDPLREQYLRLNRTPSERYVLTPAGSVKHRLWPHESGFDNLALAGDWTRTSIDGGSVEAAVESGMLAATWVARTTCAQAPNLSSMRIAPRRVVGNDGAR